MKNKRQLLEKKEQYSDFLKSVNLRRIKLLSEIDIYKKQISFVKNTINSMKNVKDILNKESKFLSYFETNNNSYNKKSLKNIYFFIQTNDDTNVGEYSDKKIIEYIKKNIELKNDIIYIIGKRLFDHIEIKLKNVDVVLLGDVVKSWDQEFENNFSILFNKISDISFTLYSDNLVNKIFLLYSDIKNPKNLFKFNILPLDLNTIKSLNLDDVKASKFSGDIHSNYANKIFNDFHPSNSSKISFISQIISINETFLKLILFSISKYVVITYLLNMCLRRLISLDEEEKNLEEKMKKNHTDLLTAKNEEITNEMIQLSSTRKIITKNSKIEALFMKKKKENEEVL